MVACVCVRVCKTQSSLMGYHAFLPLQPHSMHGSYLSLSRSRLEEREISHHAYPQQKSIISASRLSFLILAQPCGRHRRSSSSSSGSR